MSHLRCLTASVGMSLSPYVTRTIKINIHALFHLCLHNTSCRNSGHFIYLHHNSTTLNRWTMNLTIRFTFTVINLWYFICLTSGNHSYTGIIGIRNLDIRNLGFGNLDICIGNIIDIGIGIICLTSGKHSISNI